MSVRKLKNESKIIKGPIVFNPHFYIGHDHDVRGRIIISIYKDGLSDKELATAIIDCEYAKELAFGLFATITEAIAKKADA